MEQVNCNIGLVYSDGNGVERGNQGEGHSSVHQLMYNHGNISVVKNMLAITQHEYSSSVSYVLMIMK